MISWDGRWKRWLAVTALWLVPAGSAGCGERDVNLGQRGPDAGEGLATLSRDGGVEKEAGGGDPDARRLEDAALIRDAAIGRDAALRDVGCPPVPSCNWCGAPSFYDDNGCLAGFGECANGVSPCAVPPCSQTPPTGCALDEFCGDDMLCWPKGGSDAGVGV